MPLAIIGLIGITFLALVAMGLIGRIIMDVNELTAKVTALGASVDTLIAKVGTAQPPVDLQPVADAVDAIRAKVDAANAS